MDEMCRICLQYTPLAFTTNIFHKITSNKSVAQLVNELASIEIYAHDLLPKHLCVKCYQQLLTLSSFRNQIITSDAHLKEKFQVSCKDNVTIITPKLFEQQSNSHKLILKSDSTNNDSTKLNITQQLKDELLQAAVSEQDIRVEAQMQAKSAGRKPSGLLKSRHKIHEFNCEICNKILFGRSNRLEQHIIMAHSDIKNHCCETCNRKFKSKQQLVNHTRVHTGEKPYKCEVCQKFFASAQNLFNHKKKHSGTDKSFACELCMKGYSTPGELETHKRIVHTGEKPFMCEICSQTYSSNRNLGLHIRTVHEKTEKCSKCDIMLSKKRIKAHMQKHLDKELGVRRFTCDKCGKGFFTTHSLKRHQIIHSGEKPHSCKICQKAFRQKTAMDVHMKTHSDVRNFCCELCSKTFKYKQHLQRHVPKKHQNELGKY
ncbi:zinc finger protein OZF-like [Euwallacea fornicatus]|uniref:zinc finger protein OZF-like n=1 Tax=Euwallacea fornicatus TaxID=995702 RepID=UPI00338F2C25